MERASLRRAARALAVVVVLAGAWLSVGVAYLGRGFACWKRQTEQCAAAESAWTLALVTAVIAALGVTWAVWSRNRRRVLIITGIALVLPAALAGYHAWEDAGSAAVTRPAVVTDVRPVERFEGDDGVEVCWAATREAPLARGCVVTWSTPSRTFHAGDDVQVTIERFRRTGPWEATWVDPADDPHAGSTAPAHRAHT